MVIFRDVYGRRLCVIDDTCNQVLHVMMNIFFLISFDRIEKYCQDRLHVIKYHRFYLT